MKHLTSHISHFTSYLLLLTSAFILASCEYKDLCYDHNHWIYANTTYDWSHVAAPKPMRAMYYNLSDSEVEPIIYDFSSNGGLARLTGATYQAISYNNDTETILYRNGNSLNTLEAYTRQSSLEEGTRMSFTRGSMPHFTAKEPEKVILEPDSLYGAVSEPFSAELADTVDVQLQPKQRFHEIVITITNVPNLQYTTNFGGAMSGLAASINMATGVPSDELATEAFECSVIDATTLQMKLRIFGHCPHESEGEFNNHILTIYAVLADGQKWYYTQDVSSQMHEQSQSDENYKIEIKLDGLPVPKPIVNGGGFQPTVDGWQGVNIDVTM